MGVEALCCSCRGGLRKRKKGGSRPMIEAMTLDSAIVPSRRAGQIRIHPPADFEGMRKAGALTAKALDLIGPLVKPGVTTNALDRFIYEFARDHGAYPAPLHYKGYTKSICTSINHVVCHGIPDDKPLRSEDIVNIDVTLVVDGWHGDSSRMYVAGEAPRKAQRLIDVTLECLNRGVAAVRPGATVGDIGHAIQTYAEAERCSVVRDFCGHGLGRLFHDEPNVLHVGRRGEGPVLKPGMFFTIEPMINLGGAAVKVLSDGWTAVTRDRSLSAQFEHTVAVTETGVEVFTASPMMPWPAAAP
jgi:methionyl aminopeptidase